MTWLVEQGIGEERALLYDRGQAVAARLRWPGLAEPGMIVDAPLIERTAGSPRGRARLAGGEEVLVDRLPGHAGEGAPLRLEITRSAMAERGRTKPAQARPSQGEPRAAPTLAERLPQATIVRRFPDAAWDAVWSEAWDAAIGFPGGELHFAPTAAMTLIDVDGALAPRALALAAVAPIAAALARLDLGGSIGIDFPTLSAKSDRQAVDAALAGALAGWPHERTAMNGFGFVQLVARSQGPSLLHRLAFDRAGAAARNLLARAERLEGAGALSIAAHPAVLAAIRAEWREELARRTGREVRETADAALAIGAGHAQIVPR
jgi:hypothetical protein